MGSRNRNRLGQFLLVMLCALVASGPLLAKPDLEELKKEIKKLEAQLPALQKAHREAVNKLDANKTAQAKSDGDELAALKRKGMALSNNVASADDKVRDLRRKISDKQGEMRETAADHAIKRMNAKGLLAERIHDAIFALEEWEKSLGSLPDVPAPRDLGNFVDPLLKAAAKKEDKRRLETFDDWARGEEKRIDDEIEKVEKLIDKKNVVKGADDEKLYNRECKSLKDTLESRKKQVKKLRESAESKLKKLG